MIKKKDVHLTYFDTGPLNNIYRYTFTNIKARELRSKGTAAFCQCITFNFLQSAV